MTLIAAFPCHGGVVLAADSQETVSVWNEEAQNFVEYRKTAQKITPRQIGNFHIAIAGSGNSSLIDSFVPLMERKLAVESGDSLSHFLRCAEETLKEFYELDVALYPDPNKDLKMFFAAVAVRKGEYGIWVQNNVRLCPIAAPELVGWDESLYVGLMKRLCVAPMTVPRALLAAIYVLTIAEQSSNYVRGPMTVAVVKQNGIWMQDAEYVETIGKQLREYEGYTNRMLLACADTSIYAADLQAWVEGLGKIVRALHEQHINVVVAQMHQKGFQSAVDGVDKVPPGILVQVHPDGRRIVRHDVNGIEEMCRRINEGEKMEPNG